MRKKLAFTAKIVSASADKATSSEVKVDIMLSASVNGMPEAVTTGDDLLGSSDASDALSVGDETIDNLISDTDKGVI